MRSQNGIDSKWKPSGTCQKGPSPSPYPYWVPGPPEVQVDSLARLVEMSLHILFPEAQECVHADVEATLRLLQDKTQGRNREDETWPGEKTKTWAQTLLVSRRKVLFSNTGRPLANHLFL